MIQQRSHFEMRQKDLDQTLFLETANVFEKNWGVIKYVTINFKVSKIRCCHQLNAEIMSKTVAA